MANIYGVLTSTWLGKCVGVVVVERVPHTMRSWLLAIVTLRPRPDTISVDLVFRWTAQFFGRIIHMADTLHFHLPELTLDHVGVRGTGVNG